MERLRRETGHDITVQPLQLDPSDPASIKAGVAELRKMRDQKASRLSQWCIGWTGLCFTQSPTSASLGCTWPSYLMRMVCAGRGAGEQCWNDVGRLDAICLGRHHGSELHRRCRPR